MAVTVGRSGGGPERRGRELSGQDTKITQSARCTPPRVPGRHAPASLVIQPLHNNDVVTHDISFLLTL